MNSTHILARVDLHFILFFISSTEPIKFLASLLGRSFVLILAIAQLDIILEIFILFYFGYRSACNLASVFARVIGVKVNVCVREDEVKLNYSHLILSQREPYIDYVENKEKQTKGI